MTNHRSSSPVYDFILAGGGLAGLSLALEIVRSPLRGRRILIVDRDPKQGDDRTFSYWSHRPGPFDPWAYSTWDQLSFHAPGFTQTVPLDHYRYHTIRGIDFYRLAHQELADAPGVSFLTGQINHLREQPGRATISVDGQEYTGLWAFDSRPPSMERSYGDNHSPKLRMIFRGWDITTSRPVFNPQAATLMDFRTPADGDMRFFYVLPFDERHALVEHTLFTPHSMHRSTSDHALRSYLRSVFQLSEGSGCQISFREAGSLPITDQHFPRRRGQRILAVGLRGGRLKPSTGYAFTRIQQDSQAILRSLIRHGHPFELPGSPAPFPQMDSILLEIICRYPQYIPGIFTALFRKNPMEHILRFLDEDATPVEIGLIMSSLPPGLFLKVAVQRGLTSFVSEKLLLAHRDWLQ